MTEPISSEVETICRQLRNEADRQRDKINSLHNMQMSEAPHYEAQAKMFERAADLLALFDSRSKR